MSAFYCFEVVILIDLSIYCAGESLYSSNNEKDCCSWIKVFCRTYGLDPAWFDIRKTCVDTKIEMIQ